MEVGCVWMERCRVCGLLFAGVDGCAKSLAFAIELSCQICLSVCELSLSLIGVCTSGWSAVDGQAVVCSSAVRWLVWCVFGGVWRVCGRSVVYFVSLRFHKCCSRLFDGATGLIFIVWYEWWAIASCCWLLCDVAGYSSIRMLRVMCATVLAIS